MNVWDIELCFTYPMAHSKLRCHILSPFWCALPLSNHAISLIFYSKLSLSCQHWVLLAIRFHLQTKDHLILDTISYHIQENETYVVFAHLILSALTSKVTQRLCQQKHVNAYFIKILHCIFGDKLCLIVLKGPYIWCITEVFLATRNNHGSESCRMKKI